MGKAIIINDLEFTTNIGVITITNPDGPDIELTSIDLSNNTTNVINSAQLTVTYTPSNATTKTLTWTSSNTSIATVSSTGLVTVVSAGTTVITATSVSNNTISSQITLNCTLSDIPIESVTITGQSSANVGETILLTATILPQNATNKTITWSSSNSDIATVSGTGLVTAVSAGTVTITATSVSNNTISSQKTITIEEEVIGTYPTSGLLCYVSALDKTSSDVSTVLEDISTNNLDFNLTGFLMNGNDGWGNGELLFNSTSVGIIKSSSQIIDGGLSDGVDGEATFFIRAKRGVSTAVYRLFYPNVNAGDSYNYSLRISASGISLRCGNNNYTLPFSISGGAYFTAGVRIIGNTIKIYANNTS